jgi:hypothetical protein
VKGEVPLETVAEIDPLLSPLQETLVVDKVMSGFEFTVIVSVLLYSTADDPSVTFLLYEVVAARVGVSSKVLLEAPEMSDQVVPPLVDFCHCSVNVPVPPEAEVLFVKAAGSLPKQIV